MPLFKADNLLDETVEPNGQPCLLWSGGGINFEAEAESFNDVLAEGSLFGWFAENDVAKAKSPIATREYIAFHIVFYI